MLVKRFILWSMMVSAAAQVSLAQEFRQVYPAFETNEMTDICGKGDTLFITTLNWGLLRSTDAGKTWQDILSGEPRFDLLRVVPGADVLFCVPVPSTTTAERTDVYAARKLLRLDHATGTWKEINVPRMFGYCISMDISGDTRALFLLQSGWDSLSFHRSMDGGQSWELLPLPVLQSSAYFSFHQPAIVFRDSLHGVFVHGDTRGHTLYLTTDAGRHWAPVPTTPNFGEALTHLQRPALCWFDDSGFAYIDQGQVLVYTSNMGATWIRGVRISASLTSISMHPDGRTYAADVHGDVWRSDTFGASWVRIREEIVSSVALTRQYSMKLLGRDTLVLATSEGHIWRTSDGGTTWDDPRTANLAWAPVAHFVDSAYGWLAGEIGEQVLEPCILRTTDGGYSWTPTGRFKDDYRPAVHFFITRSTGFVLDARTGGSDTMQSLYRSTDSGGSWSVVYELPFRDGYAADELVRGVWYADSSLIVLPSRNGGFHRSTDAGRNWRFVGNVFDTTGGDRLHCMNVWNGHFLWACTNRKVYRSIDGGLRWEEMRVISPQNAAFGFRYVFVLDTQRIIVSEYTGGQNIMHTTTDDGTTWTTYPTALQTTLPTASLHANGHGIYLTGDGPGFENLAGSRIYRTRDSWRTMESEVWEYRSSMDTRLTSMYFLDDTFAWLFSRTGVFRTTNGGVNWTALPPVVPHSAAIGDVFPQPVLQNDVLNVRLRNGGGAVRLELRDLLGRLVSVLHDGEHAGSGIVQWTAQVPPGVYVLSLSGRGLLQARTVVVR